MASLYKFQIVNGAVQAVYEYEKGRFQFEAMERNESWTFDGTQVVKTETKKGVVKTTFYTDLNGDGIFEKAGGGTTFLGTVGSGGTGTAWVSGPSGYRFAVTDGVVTGVQEVKNGQSQLERIDANETYTVSGTDIVKTETEHGMVETTVYRDVDGDGLFNKVSKTYASTGSTGVGTVWDGSHYGGDQNDRWSGSASNDYYHGGLGQDVLAGGLGDDDLYGGDGDDQINGGVGSDDLYGGSGNDSLLGGDGDDHLYGATGNDTVNAGNGNDLIVAGGTDGTGDDIYNGEAGSDTVEYTGALAGITVNLNTGTATSSLKTASNLDPAAIGNDRLYNIENAIAGEHNDVLVGSAGNNRLEAGAGDDLLVGGWGQDTLVGGAGNDLFRYESVNQSGITVATRDTIADLASGDKIDLSMIDAVAGNRTNDAFVFIGDATALKASNANGAVWFDNGVLYASNDADLAPELSIQLTGVTQFGAAEAAQYLVL